MPEPLLSKGLFSALEISCRTYHGGLRANRVVFRRRRFLPARDLRVVGIDPAPVCAYYLHAYSEQTFADLPRGLIFKRTCPARTLTDVTSRLQSLRLLRT